MYLDLANSLKQNTEIMEATFRKCNLKVLQFSYRPYSDDDADCQLIIEVSTIDGDSIEDDVFLKINLYDENGEIIYNTEEDIYSDEYAGYDTFNISLRRNNRILKEAKSARIFVSKIY